jgi:hypothetical protein
MFVSEFRSLPYLKGASQAPALPAIIRLGWKGLPGTNTLAYYKNPKITKIHKLPKSINYKNP